MGAIATDTWVEPIVTNSGWGCARACAARKPCVDGHLGAVDFDFTLRERYPFRGVIGKNRLGCAWTEWARPGCQNPCENARLSHARLGSVSVL